MPVPSSREHCAGPCGFKEVVPAVAAIAMQEEIAVQQHIINLQTEPRTEEELESQRKIWEQAVGRLHRAGLSHNRIRAAVSCGTCIVAGLCADYKTDRVNNTRIVQRWRKE